MNFSPGIIERSIEIESKNDSINKDDEVLFVSLASSNASVLIDKTSGVTVVIINGNGGKCLVIRSTKANIAKENYQLKLEKVFFQLHG